MAELKSTLKRIFKPLALFLRRLTKALFKDVQIELERQIERWTWERYQRVERLSADLSRQIAEQNSRSRTTVRTQAAQLKETSEARAEKIHIGILFQIPSAWASLESVWEALTADPRFEAKLYIYDEVLAEKAQMAGGRKFLQARNIPYTVVEQYTLLQEKPDVLIYQTPWDERHRPKWLQSDVVSKLGIRVAYITYGLNYSASVWKDYIFSDLKFRAYPWMIFTFSERMKFDHICLSPRGGDNVISVGHPKFDALAHREDYPLPRELTEKIAGRKIVFIQIHFPGEDGNPSIPEADIRAYISFLQKADSYHECFFIVRPHPKTLEYYEQHELEQEADALKKALTSSGNVFWDQDPDYRPALFAADYVIGDRSALLIEAAALHIPVLYMTNYYYKEKILPAVQPLFESYYQGSFAFDMEAFMDMVVLRGLDYKKEEREKAAHICLPPVDGLAGKHIADTIAEAVYQEEGNYA